MVLFQEQYYSFLSLFLFIFLALIIYSNTSIASTSINVYCPFTCNSKSLDKTGSNGITYLNINKSEAISEDKVVDKNTVTLGDNEALSEIEAIGKEEDAPIVEKETPRINDVSTSIEVSGVSDATFPSANDVDYVISKQIYDEFYYKNFNQRILYIDAIEAYQNGDFDKLSNLVNNELKDYILVDNLKYLLLLSPKAKFNEILEFINSDNHLDLSASLRAYYVRYYGYKRNYSKLFKISKKQPNHNSLKCIWVNAKLDTKSSTKKQKNKIISNIRKDYINGEVIPGSCRGIVDNLVKQKKITADDIINRLKNIYWTRGSENRFKETIEHLNLIKDNRKKYSKAIALLKKLYNQPEKYNNFVNYHYGIGFGGTISAYMGMRCRDAFASTKNVFDALYDEKSSVQRIKRIMCECDAYFAFLSGSGPSVVGVFSDSLYAEDAQEILKDLGVDSYMCVPISLEYNEMIEGKEPWL
jgi:hypothetical protein